jgi:hypothetical protein
MMSVMGSEHKILERFFASGWQNGTIAE